MDLAEPVTLTEPVRSLKPWHIIDIARLLCNPLRSSGRIGLDRFVSELEDGDPVLGLGRGFGAAIQAATTDSPATHIFVKITIAGEPYLAEVNREDHPSKLHIWKRPKNGSQAVCVAPAKQRIEEYLLHEGLDVFSRKLVGVSPTERAVLNQAIIDLARKIHVNGNHFETSLAHFTSMQYPYLGALMYFLSKFGIPLSTQMPKEEKRRVWCSRFVAEAMANANILDLQGYHGPYEIKPADFTEAFENDITRGIRNPRRGLPWRAPTRQGLGPQRYV